MSFNINAIPADARNKVQIQAHLELYNRTQDVIRVHNPTSEDFIVHHDRKVSNEQYRIPAKDKDIGFGKGNNDVPRYIALHYINKMGMEIISKQIKEDWEKKKGKFRLEEQGMMEERLALRSNDPELWKKVSKELWLGVVRRYQGESYDDPEPVQERKDYGSMAEAAINELNMFDQEVGVASTSEHTEPSSSLKDDFINQAQ